MRNRISGTAELITLLVVLSVIAIRVPSSLSAGNPSQISPSPVHLTPTYKGLETVGAAGDEYCCGYYSPDNPYSCWCEGTEGNCVWWAYYKRPETVHWTGSDQICPSGWATYAIEEGLPVGAIPLDGALMTMDRGTTSCGHVAYVESVSEHPPSNHSVFQVTEMNCGIHNCERRWNYTADGGSNIHFIYKTEGVPHLLMQKYDLSIFPPSPICAPNQIYFEVDIENFGEQEICPTFYALFTKPYGQKVELTTGGCQGQPIGAGQWIFAQFKVEDWLKECDEAGWWTLEQISYSVPGDGRRYPLIPRCYESGCKEQQIRFCIQAPKGAASAQAARLLRGDECPAGHLYPTPTATPKPTSTPPSTPTPIPSNCGDGGSTGVYLYSDRDFKGACSYFTSSDADLADEAVGDNEASSIRIVGSYTAELYENEGYGGRSEEFSHDDPNLDDHSLGSQWSSIKVKKWDVSGEGVILNSPPLIPISAITLSTRMRPHLLRSAVPICSMPIKTVITSTSVRTSSTMIRTSETITMPRVAGMTISHPLSLLRRSLSMRRVISPEDVRLSLWERWSPTSPTGTTSKKTMSSLFRCLGVGRSPSVSTRVSAVPARLSPTMIATLPIIPSVGIPSPLSR